jgi:ATP-binding cassette, subfamily B, bacterial
MSKSSQDKLTKKDKKPNIFGILRPYTGMIILLIVFALLSNGVNLLIPKIISQGIDSFTSGKYILKTIVVEFLVSAFIIFIFTLLQSVIQVYSSERVAKDMRAKLSDKISRQNYNYIQKANPSKLLTNLTSDIDSIKSFVSQAIVSIASSVFIIIGACILLLTINWKLALPVIMIIPIIGGTFFIIFRKVKVLFKRGREVIDWLNKVINESILGSAVIRVLNSQQLEYKKFLDANTNARDIGISILTLFATLIPIITFTAHLATLTILALGGHFVVNGTMSLGDFAAFNSYVTILIFPIIIIGFMSNIIAQASASYQRISEVLDAPEIKEDGSVVENLIGDIDLKNINVNFGEKPILKDVSFSVKAGSLIAVIGPTAAGKSQLLNLLTGLITPDSGTVEFDGRSINSYNKESFHSQIGFVFQDSILFNMSLRENIAFSDIVTDESLEKAIETAELKEYINLLPNKLDTIVSERGLSLSGGQKQRIMLARALAVNPKILLLDDFTARVDKKTEEKILCNLMNNYPDLTLISVTQKISSVKHYDQIVVLMEGEVIAIGKHKELLESCPEYVQIYNSQRSTSHYELQS